jgi:hypothetical protein
MNDIASNCYPKKAKTGVQSGNAWQVKNEKKQTKKICSLNNECKPMKGNANETGLDELLKENSNKTGEDRDEEVIICVFFLF